jgi:hypothetical protein
MDWLRYIVDWNDTQLSLHSNCIHTHFWRQTGYLHIAKLYNIRNTVYSTMDQTSVQVNILYFATELRRRYGSTANSVIH